MSPLVRLVAVLACTVVAVAEETAPTDQPAPAAPPATATAQPANGPTGTFTIVLVSATDPNEKTEDVITLDGATLSSQSYGESRFAPGALTSKGGGRFEATMTSPRGAQAIWSGTITGDAIEGRVLTGVKGKFDVSTYSGTRRP